MPSSLVPAVKTSKFRKLFPFIRRQRNYILGLFPSITQNNRPVRQGAAWSSLLLPFFFFFTPFSYLWGSSANTFVKGCRDTYVGQSISSPRETIINSVLEEVSEIPISVTKTTRNSRTAASEKRWWHHKVMISQTPHKKSNNCAEWLVKDSG